MINVGVLEREREGEEEGGPDVIFMIIGLSFLYPYQYIYISAWPGYQRVRSKLRFQVPRPRAVSDDDILPPPTQYGNNVGYKKITKKRALPLPNAQNNTPRLLHPNPASYRKCAMCFGRGLFSRSAAPRSAESASSSSSAQSARARRAQLWAAGHRGLEPVPPEGGINFVYIVRRTQREPAPRT